MKKSAFTLIELSIVLVIIGLLIGGSFKILKVMRERAQITRAQDDVQVAKQAVIGNTILNYNILPPVDYFDQNLSPVKSNQHQLLYAYADTLDGNNICSTQSTSLKIEKKHFDTVKQTINNIAFVVVSEGANHNMQTAKSGNTVKIYDYETNDRDDNATPVDIKENYDDVADWVTLSQLQEEARCSNNPLRIVNSSLPSTNIANSSSYSATIVIDGNYSSPNLNCNFTDNNRFFLSNNFVIKNTGTIVGSTNTVVDCNVSADGKTVAKKFTINVSN